jgi:hypothetical protein
MNIKMTNLIFMRVLKGSKGIKYNLMRGIYVVVQRSKI